MMKFLKQISVFFLLATAFVSCNDEDPDTAGPTIEITNISDNQEFKFGENLVMHFKFTDQTGVYEYSYEIYAKEYTPKEFSVSQKLITFEGYFNEKTDNQTVILPEKSPTETYAEGDYIIKVQASDINQRVSTYYKPIRIVYPETQE